MKIYIQLCLWALTVLWKLKTITKADRLRLWRKTLNLFLCFLAFCDRERPKAQLRGAMICALLSALYDYETDWVPINGPDSLYRDLLYKTVTDIDTRKIAWELFETDLRTHLSKHGLERGSAALAFYRIVIGSEWLGKYSAKQIESYGRNLQIVDDILDLEEDTVNGHTNCLLTNEREQYLREAKEFSEGDFCRTLEQNSMIYYKICFRLFGHRSKETPTVRDLMASCRPHTGLFAFVLTIVGFKIIKLSLLPAIPIALAFCGITLSIMVFNDLMDKHRDLNKGKTLATRYPWHIFRTWKWISGITILILLITAIFWWKLTLFCGFIWVLGLIYSIEKLSYPVNNLLVAFCSGSPALLGMIQRELFDLKVLFLFFIVSSTIVVMETIKDMQDKATDIGHKDTLATRIAWPMVAMQAVFLCYLPIIGVMLYPNELVRSLGYLFGVLVFFLGLSFTRRKSLFTAELAGNVFLVALLFVLLFTQ